MISKFDDLQFTFWGAKVVKIKRNAKKKVFFLLFRDARRTHSHNIADCKTGIP